jgi:hypothetical protein
MDHSDICVGTYNGRQSHCEVYQVKLLVGKLDILSTVTHKCLFLFLPGFPDPCSRVSSRCAKCPPVSEVLKRNFLTLVVVLKAIPTVWCLKSDPWWWGHHKDIHSLLMFSLGLWWLPFPVAESMVSQWWNTELFKTPQPYNTSLELIIPFLLTFCIL